MKFSSLIEKRVQYQYYAAFCANLLTIPWGVCIGWASPCIPILTSDQSPLPSGKLADDQVSDVISLLCVGGLLGNFFHAYIADKYGRKISLIAAGPIQILGWLVTIYAQNPGQLMLARFLLGWAGAPVFNVTNIFVSEFSEDKVRGFLGSWMILITNIGVLLGYGLGAYLPYTATPWIMIPFSIVFIITMIFIPESPQYLVQVQKFQEAEKSLKYFRNTKEEEALEMEAIQTELQLFKDVIEAKKNEEKLTLQDFKVKTGYKPLLYGIFLIAVEVFCGGHAMLSYTATIFQESGSSLNPNDSAMVVGVIQIVGSYLSTLLVERAGRKILMSVSCIGSALGLLVLSIYAYCNSLGLNVESLNWIPLVSFSFVIFIQNLGILSIPFLYLAEISPQKIRGFINSLNNGLSWFYTYLTIKYMHIFLTLIGMHGTMLLYAIVSIVGTFLIVVFIPETKGKSIEEIIQLLEK